MLIGQLLGEASGKIGHLPVTAQANPSALLLTATATVAGLYRKSHLRIMRYPHTAMLTASDLRGPHGINKSGYCVRTARVALAPV